MYYKSYTINYTYKFKDQSALAFKTKSMFAFKFRK